MLRMPALSRTLLAASFMVLASASSCTLVKPVIGAFTGPVFGAQFVGPGGCGCHGDGRAVLALFAFFAAAGAGVGLVTGIVSDVQALTGDARDPCRNWYDPFATNTSR